MNFEQESASPYTLGELLERAAARTGFSTLEMQELLECELEMEQLLTYIDAVVTNRMN